MTATRVTFFRALGHARAAYATAVSVALFFLAAGASFAFALVQADGTAAALAPLWTVSVSRVLPLLAALLSMDAWSEECRTGFDEVLLATAVRERSLVIGKFLAAWAGTFAAVVLFLLTTLTVLNAFAPLTLEGVPFVAFLPGLVALAAQGILWCATTCLFSAAMRSSALVFLVSAAFNALLPRALWAALVRSGLSWTASLGESPFDAQAADLAVGGISLGMLLGEAAIALASLFAASKIIAMRRFSGARARGMRVTSRLVALLAFVVALLFALLLVRFDLSFDLPIGSGAVCFSERTRKILHDGLIDTHANLTITAFMPRNDPQFRRTARSLRALAREAQDEAGVRLNVRFVDPRWDIAESSRLVRSGIPANSIAVSQKGRLPVILPLSEGLGERVLAGAVLNVALPPQRRTVYWTFGHGEASYTDYGGAGLSDIARELMRDGYKNRTIDLTDGQLFPTDCALVVAAGPRDDFSVAETARLDAYLKQGGRLAVLMDADSAAGVTGLLSAWGIRVSSRDRLATPVYVADFAAHPITTPLHGSRVAFGPSLALFPSAAVTAGIGMNADRIAYTRLVQAEGRTLAAISERGTGAGEDTALRPTRLVVFGDTTFALNASLKSLANANRDFFLNAVMYLAGSDALTAGGPDGGILTTDFDPDRRAWFVATLVLGVPGVLLAFFALIIFIRRHR